MFRLLVNNFPNVITIINSFLGFCSILASFQAVIEFYLSVIGKSEVDPSTYLALAGLFIILAAFFDFFDGFFARLLNVSSKIGKQMDSFADLVSFGVAPGVLFFTVTMIAGDHIPGTNIYYRMNHFISHSLLPHIIFLKILAFVCPSVVIIRLARFNTIKDNRSSFYFEGITSTLGGGFIALIFTFNFINAPAIYLLSLFGIRWQFMENINGYFHLLFHNYYFLLIAYLFICFMMVSTIPYRKFNLILKFLAKKKFIWIHLLFLFFLLFFFRYTILISIITYLIFGVRGRLKEKAVT